MDQPPENLRRLPADAGSASAWGEDLPLTESFSDPVTFDLSILRQVDPLFAIRLAAEVCRCADSGLAVKIIPPEADEPKGELVSLGLKQSLPVGVEIDIEAVDQPDAILVPVTRLRTHDDSDQLDLRLEPILAELFEGAWHQMGMPFHKVIAEMCDNATTHGSSPTGAFVVAKRYGPTNCVIAIGDLGIGTPEHLRQAQPGLLQDVDALLEATKEGVSGTGSPDRGNGHHWVRKEMLEGKVPRGEMQIWSGSARYDARFRYGQPQLEEVGSADATVGTWLRVGLRLD